MYNMGPYDDIIDLPHHVSQVHPRMPMIKRAAQFAPFAAVTGYAEAIWEATRLTQKRIELDVDEAARVDGRLQKLKENLQARPKVSITFFVPDKKKEGGAYVTSYGVVERIDCQKGRLMMECGEVIPIGEIIFLDGDLFLGLED